MKYKLFTIGFAAETENLKKNATKKLKEKKISVIAANKVSFSEGIESIENSITLYWGEGKEKLLKLKHKKDLAREFVEEISYIYN
jgi:phosphopantothenoylcysteine decarboxylase/phosphopantothenate--cysteine ligase